MVAGTSCAVTGAERRQGKLLSRNSRAVTPCAFKPRFEPGLLLTHRDRRHVDARRSPRRPWPWTQPRSTFHAHSPRPPQPPRRFFPMIVRPIAIAGLVGIGILAAGCTQQSPAPPSAPAASAAAPAASAPQTPPPAASAAASTAATDATAPAAEGAAPAAPAPEALAPLPSFAQSGRPPSPTAAARAPRAAQPPVAAAPSPSMPTAAPPPEMAAEAAPPPPAEMTGAGPAMPPEVIVMTAPPPPRVERIPAPRPGYEWIAGYWSWNARAHRHVWVNGRFETVRSGYVWVPARWVQRRNGWQFQPGHWVVRGPMPHPPPPPGSRPPPPYMPPPPPPPRRPGNWVTVPPPAPRIEPIVQRPGFVYSTGYWRWNGARFDWVPGNYVRKQPDQRWVQPHWSRAPNGMWRFEPGHWQARR